MPELTKQELVRHFKTFLVKQPIHGKEVFMIAYGEDAVALCDLFEKCPDFFELMLEEYAAGRLEGGPDVD